MIDVTLLELEELLVVGFLHADEVIVGLRQRADQFVELQLRGGLFAPLRVVEGEDHDERERGRHGGERDLPRLGKAGDGQDEEEASDRHAQNGGGGRVADDEVESVQPSTHRRPRSDCFHPPVIPQAPARYP
jgi:hypothetical protein